jgi:hypothetical protein
MVRVLALVEGPTERNFGQKLLAAHLADHGIEFRPRVIGKPGHKGGAGPWDRAKRELLALMRQEPKSVCTTMFDLYALPTSWPGREEAAKRGLKNLDAVTFVEREIARAMSAEFQGGEQVARFIPYLSLHEYEALLFSNPTALASVTQGPDHATRFQEIVVQCGECEKINDSPSTSPSNRILRIARGYVKTVDGINAAERIGISSMRTQCPHFGSWLTQLESCGNG